MKRTAVNWLIDKLEREYNSFPWYNAEACIKAQEMEKEQLEKAIEFGAEGMYSEEEVYELMIKAFNAGFNKYESVEAGLEGKETDLECANILKKYIKTKIDGTNT